MYKPNIIEGENLSIAWGKTLKECRKSTGQTICPAIISFDARSEIKNIEITNIRKYLEDFLYTHSSKIFIQSPIETVAGTIFPQSIWKMSNNNPETFYNKYKRMWPHIKKCRSNTRGVYFQRLISYGEEEINQLEKIISTWHKRVHRLSALQAGIFDPNKDHVCVRQLGFPCLQQIVFQPLGTNGQDGLAVIAFYANQLLIDKAYGNCLGLYRLGRFMAGQMGIELKKVRCIAASLKLGDYSKSNTRELETNVIREIENAIQSL